MQCHYQVKKVWTAHSVGMSNSILLRSVLRLPSALKAGQLRCAPLPKPRVRGSIKSCQGESHGRQKKRKLEAKAISRNNNTIVKTLKKGKNSSICSHASIDIHDARHLQHLSIFCRLGSKQEPVQRSLDSLAQWGSFSGCSTKIRNFCFGNREKSCGGSPSHECRSLFTQHVSFLIIIFLF